MVAIGYEVFQAPYGRGRVQSSSEVQRTRLSPRGGLNAKKPELDLLRLRVLDRTSGRQCLHEVRAYRRLDYIVLEGDCRGQIRLHDFRNSRIHVLLIALCIPLLRPESNGDGLLSSGVGHERQDLQEARLLLQDGQHLVAYNLK